MTATDDTEFHRVRQPSHDGDTFMAAGCCLSVAITALIVGLFASGVLR